MNLKELVKNPIPIKEGDSVHFHEWNGQQVNSWELWNRAISACQQVVDEEMKKLFEEIEGISVMAYKEGELGTMPPTDMCIDLERWQSLKERRIGVKKIKGVVCRK